MASSDALDPIVRLMNNIPQNWDNDIDNDTDSDVSSIAEEPDNSLDGPTSEISTMMGLEVCLALAYA